jgi:alpha-tubulin suppressor-like RCC1 family protein/rubredoxin
LWRAWFVLSISFLISGCSNETKVGVFNAPPDAVITSHGDGSVVVAGEATTLTGAVSDPDGAPESLTLIWTIDGKPACANVFPDEVGYTSCTWTFQEGGGSVILQVWDLGGASDSDTLDLAVSPNQAPTASLLSPVANQRYYGNQLVTFQGEMKDHEDLPRELVGRWESSIDGLLALDGTPDSSGVVLDFGNLSEGNHALVFTATDSAGQEGHDSVTITVGAPNSAPSCGILEPTSGSSASFGQSVVFSGFVGDADITPDQLAVSWTSDLDGLLANSAPTSAGDVTFSAPGLSAGTHTITLAAEDEVGATCVDAVSLVVGTPPTVDILLPVMADAFQAGDVISFKASASDAEDPATDLEIEWTSDIDGLLGTPSPASNGVAQFTSANLSQGVHTLTVTVTDTIGLYAQDMTFIEVGANSAPSIGSAFITPDPAYIGDTLNCTYSGYFDVDGDPDQSTFLWSINGAQVSSGPTLASGFVKGDTVQCVVTPFDGQLQGTPVSDSLTIGNSAPEASVVSISPNPAYTSDTLTCTYTYADLDGDADNSSIQWTIGGVAAGSGATLSGAFSGGDTVTCVVTPDDGTTAGIPQTASILIANQGPSISTVDIMPDPAVVSDTLTCAYSGYTDPDGDPDQSTFEWFVGGTSLGTGSTLAAGYLRGDVVTCTVTPDDGQLQGTPVSDSITIDNTAPEVRSVAITPNPAVALDTLTCGYLYDDVDGDPDSSTIDWTIGGTSVGTNSSLSGVFNQGDTVTCTVTPNDGSRDGIDQTASVLIGNQSPSISTVDITPDPAVASDTLSCAYSGYTDPDGDPDQSTFEWFIGGTAVGTGPTLAAGYFRGDVVSCTVTPDDGQLQGTPVSDSITIDNTAPDVNGVAITPNPAVASDTLTCSYVYDDVDGDPDNSTINWTIGGTSVGTNATLSGVFKQGDTVTCTVTPNDGLLDGVEQSASVKITEQTPTVSNVMIIPTTPDAGDDLECTYSYFDPDGDPDLSTIEWSVNSNSVGAGTVLAAGNFIKLDVVGCSVTPFDGTNTGVPASDQVTIGNAVPSVSNVTVLAITDDDKDGDPTTAISSDTLECAWIFDDIDWDGDNSGVEWLVDGTTVASGQTTLAGRFGVGDTVECVITPNDGTDDGLPLTGEIVIGGYIQVSAGAIHSCAITIAGEVSCWGDDTFGQSSAPTGSFASVSAGGLHSCVMTDTGDVECWGDNNYGQTNTPGLSFNSVSAGYYHTCGVTTSGDVECWGGNSYGESTPPADSFASVSAGGYHSCGVTITGDVKCWGDDSDGESSAPAGSFVQVSAGNKHSCGVTTAGDTICWGIDDGSADDYGQVTATSTTGDFVDVDAGSFHNCALGATGDVDCWGGDTFGQATPPAGVFIALSSGLIHSCGVTDAGEVECWGDDTYGQSSITPVDFISVSAGNVFSCGVTATGDLDCWGLNDYGQASPPSGSFVSVTAGLMHACGITSTDEVKCWGIDDSSFSDYGQVNYTPSGSFESVSAGGFHSCAVTAGGKVACWGSDDHGQSSPPQLLFKSVSTGYLHTCGVTTTDEVICWGISGGVAFDYGQVSDTPTGSFESVSAGWHHNCAVTTAGALQCWGADSYGQASPPTGDFVSIDGGNYHACAVTTSGDVECWGQGNWGQTTPPGGSFVSVSAGTAHTCGLTTWGYLQCWGWDLYGQSSPP